MNDHTGFDTVDLFAGPGGWDVAARDLGLNVVGIEYDHAACETRRAAGLATIEGDVRKYGPWDFPSARRLIGSPPCQTFSMAGLGAGRAALDLVLMLAHRMVEKAITADLAALDDERTGLVLEPLRWALAAVDLGQPYTTIVLEQVPTVLPAWEAIAEILRGFGYSVAVGYLSAEQHGVSQTRKRAVLSARLHGPATLPAPTHRKYRKGVAQHEGDPELLPWVSMADALGRTEPFEVVSNYGTGGDPKNRGVRLSSEPSATVTSKIDRFKLYYRGSNQAHAAVRHRDEPAPTVNFSARSNKVEWMPDRETARDPKASGVRVTPEEAATFQSFPTDHPWQGTKSQVYQQIGNAVPPLLAAHIVSAATGIPMRQEAAA